MTPLAPGATLVAWAARQAPGHPARVAWAEAAGPAVALAAGPGGPWPVARVDPVLWLAAWRAGRAVWLHPAGSRGWMFTGSARVDEDPGAAPDAPALLVPTPMGARVFSHRALWAAVQGTWTLGAAGTGLGGAEAFVQGAASWLGGQAFGSGRRLYAHPGQVSAVTDGKALWHTTPELLGVYRRVDPDGATAADPSTLVAAGGLKSGRLFDGWWRGGAMVPARFAGGRWSPAGAAGIPGD